MQLSIQGLDSTEAHDFRNCGVDANGQHPQRNTAQPGNNPCRHCLQFILPGEELLLLALRPFSEISPFAETGPIFLHGKDCDRYKNHTLPEWFTQLKPALIRCYDKNGWIRYDLSDAVSGNELMGRCKRIFSDVPGVSHIDIRTKFGCFLCRVKPSIE